MKRRWGFVFLATTSFTYILKYVVVLSAWQNKIQPYELAYFRPEDVLPKMNQYSCTLSYIAE